MQPSYYCFLAVYIQIFTHSYIFQQFHLFLHFLPCTWINFLFEEHPLVFLLLQFFWSGDNLYSLIFFWLKFHFSLLFLRHFSLGIEFQVSSYFFQRSNLTFIFLTLFLLKNLPSVTRLFHQKYCMCVCLITAFKVFTLFSSFKNFIIV